MTADDTQPHLAVRNLSAGYEQNPVLADVSLSVARGAIVAVLDTNGAARRPFCRHSRRCWSPRRAASPLMRAT